MNKDFHYEGTYCAAIEAGFEEKEARIIAKAAQAVDDCTESFLRKKGVFDVGVITMETDVLDVFKELEKKDIERLREIRKVWIPFHFLPGNLNGEVEYTGEKFYKDKKFFTERDEEDFRCLCLHNSELVFAMLEDTKKAYKDFATTDKEGNSVEREKMLYLIGVRIHVLADTWAHEFFAGTPSWWINNTTDFHKIKPNTLLNELGTPNGVSMYSIYYLGHGRAGHYPDYGFLTYTYQPQWKRKGERISKGNTVSFELAYAQMVDAMEYITGKKETLLDSDTDLSIKFYKLGNSEKVTKVVWTECTDQSDIWRKEMDITEVELPKYNADGIDADAFQEGADRHYRFVKNYLEGKGINYL